MQRAGLMAKTRATLHELSGGGVVMGTGAYRNPLARNQGVRRHKHLPAMRGVRDGGQTRPPPRHL